MRETHLDCHVKHPIQEETAMKGVLTAFLVMIAAVPAFAHHGRGSTYTANRTVELKGTVKQMAWRNPHIHFQIDVKGPNGQVTTWTIEHSNVSTLARLGYGRETLKPGMEVTVIAYPGSKGDPIGLCRKVILTDGTEIFTRGVADGDRYNPLNDID
jgi:hypothetical protein